MKKILLFSSLVLITIVSSYLAYEKDKLPLRIGMNAWPGYEYLYFAKVKGFYKSEGVDVEIIQYNSLEDTRFGYEQGQIDIMASTIIELLLTAERIDKSPQAFLIPDFSNGADVVIAKAGINDVSALKGKNIAVEPESLGLFMLARTLNKSNLEVSDVNIIGMSQQNIHQAFIDGEIDAAVTYPPVSVVLLKDLRGSSIIFDSSQIPGEVVDIVVSDENLINSRLDDFKAIVRAWDKAKKYTLENKAESYSIMSKREHITAAEFEDVLSGMVILDSKQQLQYLDVKKSVQTAMESAEKVLFESGYIKKRINVNKLINTAPLRRAYED